MLFAFRIGLATLVLFLAFISHAMAEPVVTDIPEVHPAQVDPDVLATIFSGAETLHYSVSWSGGVKIGDIFMEIKPEKSKKDAYNISAKVKDYGPLKVIYPIDDTFRCFVSGPMKLPYKYEIHQKEGYTSETLRLTLYDQQSHFVTFQKNHGPQEQTDFEGTVYNEFASFIISRALLFKEEEAIVVPTFADNKRHEVHVSLASKEKRNTLFGEKMTLKIHPKMQFKGLYEKSGDTILWLTDDKCRVPVEIHSKIVVGSLVAELVGYSNPACKELEQQRVR